MLILGVSMALLDTTIVNVALPTIRTSLDASEGTLSWIISGYALAYGLALIPSGRVGDRVGHKWVFVVGLAGFTLASLWCGLASGSMELIVARVVQGLCGGIFFPAVTALIQLMFSGRTRGKAFAVMGAAIGFSTALGPIVGGLLIEAFGEDEGWRSIFFVNLPFGVIAVAAAIVLLPRIVVGASPAAWTGSACCWSRCRWSRSSCRSSRARTPAGPGGPGRRSWAVCCCSSPSRSGSGGSWPATAARSYRPACSRTRPSRAA
nr:hypothetical protein GCM10025730_23030 [Promicromonospora thailandica]